MNKLHEIEKLVSLLPREDCIELLESISIQCYDSESTDILREAVINNILDGTLNELNLFGI